MTKIVQYLNLFFDEQINSYLTSDKKEILLAIAKCNKANFIGTVEVSISSDGVSLSIADKEIIINEAEKFSISTEIDEIEKEITKLEKKLESLKGKL